jgi:murein L,D-transpeptidase YafK
MKRASLVLLCLASALLVASAPAVAARAKKHAPIPRAPSVHDGEAEARLIEIYKLMGRANGRQALAKAEVLVRDHPNFQLAQLVYGDLLFAQSRPLRAVGDVPDTAASSGAQALAELREESQLRLRALRERPVPGTIPAQFLQLAPRNQHAIAIDTARARLYLFENSPNGLKLLADYYISVGKSGIEKSTEGDLRTPLGVYFITSSLDPKSLKDFYGAGALPINYPNPYDARRGRTGGGIWLHGAPPAQFSRPPKATDGCIVLANPDLQRIISTEEVRTTPVVIAQNLQWVAAKAMHPDNRHFADTLQAWRAAKVSGDMARLLAFYTPDASGAGKTLSEWTPQLKSELDKARGHNIELKDLSYLHWTDAADTMLVTFGEVLSGKQTGPVKRQYWVRQGPSWKIFFEGVIG